MNDLADTPPGATIVQQAAAQSPGFLHGGLSVGASILAREYAAMATEVMRRAGARIATDPEIKASMATISPTLRATW